MAAMSERLYRSRTDRVIGGVAAGVAQSLDVDPTLVRIIWAVLVIPTGGIAALVYLIMLVVVPEEPTGIERVARASAGAPAGTSAGAAAGTSPEWGDSWVPPNDATPEPARQGGGGARAAGLVLIVIGVIFLLVQLAPQLRIDVGLVWPWVSLAVGVLLLIGSVRRRPPTTP
jgi:phage shock protein PspC (stress-responsive transcriptional regulator)